MNRTEQGIYFNFKAYIYSSSLETKHTQERSYINKTITVQILVKWK